MYYTFALFLPNISYLIHTHLLYILFRDNLPKIEKAIMTALLEEHLFSINYDIVTSQMQSVYLINF